MRRTPVRPSTKPPKRSTKRIKVRGKPRFKGRVDEAFREYIRGLPCALRFDFCSGGTECAHVKPRSIGGTDRGNCVPLCRRHHSAQHLMGIQSFQRYYGLALAKLAAEYGGRYTREHDA